jgi:von Willebrand factor type D domain
MKSPDTARVRVTKLLGVLLVASLSSGLLPSRTTAASPKTAATKPSPEEAAKRKAWREAMSRLPKPKAGCFTAEYPTIAWQEVPCVTAPLRPYPPAEGPSPKPQSVGHGIAFTADVPGLISAATGSFDSINGLTSETGIGGANSYSLQLNSSFFKSTKACAGASIPANCQGWQQFVYSNTGFLVMQYWLVHYGPAACPPGWTTSPPSCYMNSASVAVPVQPLANLAQLTLTATAATDGLDTITLQTGGNIYSASGSDDILVLAQGWKLAEFNIFGDCCGSDATFNAGTTMAVRTSVTDGTMNAPSCGGQGFTSETNNLNLVPPCCPYGGASPAIVFWQSSNPGATSQCVGGTSIGDTHMTNFNGLYYDFQASGDFLLAETDHDFVVQTRQASGAPNWPNASVNKAVAMQMGKTRVAVCLEPSRFIVDGKPKNLGDGASLALPGVKVTRNGSVYVFTRPDGKSVSAELNSGWINVAVNLGSHTQTAVVHGLLGNANGNTGEDDLAARDRTVLPQPVSFADLYQRYGDSWRVPLAESLPSQLCDDRRIESGNPGRPFYANDLSPKNREPARAVCIAAGIKDQTLLEACTLDTAVLGNRTAAKVFARAKPPRAVLRPASLR